MADTISSDSIAQDQLRAFIQRIERLEEEKKAIADDIKEIYAEAKGNGFDTKVLRKIVAIRKQDHAERMGQEALLDLYMGALGMAVAPPQGDDDDYTPPRGQHRGPEHRADMGGLRPIASVTSAIVTRLDPSLHNLQTTHPAPAASSSQAERRPESPEQSAGANAEIATPPAVSAPIQPVDHYALDTADLDPARVLLANCIECRARIYEGDDHRVIGPNEEFFCSDCAALFCEPESPAIAEAGTPGSPAPDFDYSSDVTPEAVEQMRQMAAPALAAMGELEVVDPPSLTGSAADKSAGGEVSLAPAAPTKLKMNAEFFDEPHPACKRPGFCGGNSAIALCDACKAAAGITHDGPVHQPEASVH